MSFSEPPASEPVWANWIREADDEVLKDYGNRVMRRLRDIRQWEDERTQHAFYGKPWAHIRA